MKNTKRLLSLLLVMVMIFASNAYALSINGQFTVEFTADTSIDLSDLKVELYRKTNVVQYTENLQTYDKEFVTSYISDENGIITFLKPSYDFVLVIDLASLPTGTGVKKSTLLVADNEYYKEIEVETVETVTPSYNGDLNFTFQNKNGENLLVNYEVSGYDVQKTETERAALASAINMNAEAEITVVSKHKGSVSANGKMFSFDFDDTYTYSPTAHMGIDSVSCLTCARGDVALTSVSNPDALVYVQSIIACTSGNCCENGFHTLRVYYDPSGCSATNANIALNTLYDVFDFFCNQWKFRCPKSHTSTNYIADSGDSFCLIISASYNSGGGSPWEGEGENASPVLYVGEDRFAANRIEGTIAHEFMHCIQARYDVIFDAADDMIREPWANYAGMLYCESVGKLGANISDMQTGIAAYFYNTRLSLIKSVPQNSVNYSRNVAILLPILLHQYYGGVTTVKNVLENLLEIRDSEYSQRNVTDVYAALDETVSGIYVNGTSQTFRTLFENFGLYNYDYIDRYAWFQNQSWDSTIAVSETVLNLGMYNSAEVDMLGYDYYKIPSTNQMATLAINFPASITISSSTPVCYILECTSSGNILNTSRLSINYATNVTYNFASSSANYLILIVENVSVTEDLFVNCIVS